MRARNVFLAGSWLTGQSTSVAKSTLNLESQFDNFPAHLWDLSKSTSLFFIVSLLRIDAQLFQLKPVSDFSNCCDQEQEQGGFVLDLCLRIVHPRREGIKSSILSCSIRNEAVVQSTSSVRKQRQVNVGAQFALVCPF